MKYVTSLDFRAIDEVMRYMAFDIHDFHEPYPGASVRVVYRRDTEEVSFSISLSGRGKYEVEVRSGSEEWESETVESLRRPLRLREEKEELHTFDEPSV